MPATVTSTQALPKARLTIPKTETPHPAGLVSAAHESH